MRLWATLAIASLCLATPAVLHAESVFNFESVAAGSTLPLAMNVNGLTASFTGGGAICSSLGLSGAMFVTLTGNAIVQGLCTPATTAPVTITFSQPLGQLSFALAINGDTPAPVSVVFRLHGVVVNSQTINPVVPLNSVSPEAAVSYIGNFDSVTVSSASLLAIDNVDAIPLAGSSSNATPTSPGR